MEATLTIHFSSIEELKQLFEKFDMLKCKEIVKPKIKRPGKPTIFDQLVNEGKLIPVRHQMNNLKKRKCVTCGNEFYPQGPRQRRCSLKCGLKSKSQKEKEKLKKPSEPIEKTLKEVEENQRRREAMPYEFAQ
jgi:hypothetical protein